MTPCLMVTFMEIFSLICTGIVVILFLSALVAGFVFVYRLYRQQYPYKPRPTKAELRQIAELEAEIANLKLTTKAIEPAKK